MNIEVPDSIVSSLQLPEAEAKERLLVELALATYAQGILSFGKAVELARLSRWRFADLLMSRGIARHYGEDELAEDLAYGRGE